MELLESQPDFVVQDLLAHTSKISNTTDSDRLASVAIRYGMAHLMLGKDRVARDSFEAASRLSSLKSLHFLAAQYLGIGCTRKPELLEVLVSPIYKEQQVHVEFSRQSRLLAAVLLNYFRDVENEAHRKWIQKIISHLVSNFVGRVSNTEHLVNRMFGFTAQPTNKITNPLLPLLLKNGSEPNYNMLRPECLSSLKTSLSDHEFWEDMMIMFHHTAITNGYTHTPWIDSPLFSGNNTNAETNHP